MPGEGVFVKAQEQAAVDGLVFHRICFLWAMAAHREVADRQFGVVNVQPGFNTGASGLEAGRKN